MSSVQDPKVLFNLGEQFMAALEALDAHNARALERMVSLFAPDCNLTNAALKLSHIERKGQEGARAFWTDYSKSLRHAQTVFDAVTTGEQCIGLFWHTHGVDPAGKDLDYDGSTLLVVNNQGLITHFHGYFDTRALTVNLSSTELKTDESKESEAA